MIDRMLAAGFDWLPNRLPRSVVPVLITLAVTLLAIAVAIAQTITIQRDARLHATHETESLFALHTVIEAALDAETGQRGYLLTGREIYLVPYVQARKRIAAAEVMVRASFVETPYTGEGEAITVLNSLVSAKLTELDRTVQLARDGQRDLALTIVNSDLGLHQMDRIRDEASRLAAVATRQQHDATERAARMERRLVPLLVVLGAAVVVLGLLGFSIERRRGVVEAEAAQAEALRSANDHALLLTRELNHRVKNLFAVVLSIIALSARKAGDSRTVVQDISARIHALSRAHAGSQGSVLAEAVSLETVVEQIMQPYMHGDGTREQVVFGGPEVLLPVRAITPIGLMLHELATNAAKYGALSQADGTVAVSWQCGRSATGTDEVELAWIESEGPALTTTTADEIAEGFGSTMLTLAARQLSGRIDREWAPTGVTVRIGFPLG